jgi:hypothetical protein
MKIIYLFLLTESKNGSFQKNIHTPPTEEISAIRRGEKNVSDNSKCIRTSKGGRGLTSYFLRGGGMDVFWNEPMCFCYTTCFNNSCTAFWWNKLGSFSLYYFNCSIQHALVVGGNNSMAYTDYGLIDMGYWHEEN